MVISNFIESRPIELKIVLETNHMNTPTKMFLETLGEVSGDSLVAIYHTIFTEPHFIDNPRRGFGGCPPDFPITPIDHTMKT